MYKLVAIDLDGTLLDSYGNISNENMAALKRAIENGIHIVLCSGRIGTSVESFCREVGNTRFYIADNGAQVYDLKDCKTIYSNFLTKQKTLDVIKICDDNSIYYSVYTENCVLTKSLNHSDYLIYFICT